VDDAAVGLGRTLGHVAAGLKHGERNIPAGKFARNSATDDARSYDYDIILKHGISISKFLPTS
jgi:hypothetical protein